MNNHTIMKVKLLLAMLCAGVVSAFAFNEVSVHINSGNPAFPFPQFLPYSYGTKHSLDNLGTKNPEGVVHIEMEQDIRDAYQIFANEWEYTGEVMDGVKYIKGNIGCPYDCREGDGYSMLAAAVMADKESFDGLWFRIHDKFRPTATSYLTGSKVQDGGYGNLIIGDQANSCSATDGDNEIVLALYIAWRQWGDDSGHKGANGEKISYKKDMIEVVRGLVALYEERFKTENPRRVTTGDVGLDGYLKNGTTWAEVTSWANTNFYEKDGVMYKPEYAGPVKMHTDYSSPAYFKEFYDLILELDLPESNEWEREQFRRCEASCDWMVGNWLSQSPKNIFWGEEASISDDNVVTLDAGNQGGRFRAAWRTALNYVWHGNPDYTWNPKTHKVEAGGNTFEKESCERITDFMNDPQGWLGKGSCTTFGGGPKVSYHGPSTLHWDIEPDGNFPKSEFTLNWQMATGMPSAIGAGDLDLAGILYRQCNIEWDVRKGGDGYLSSVPVYFHGFFRWLGMAIATGNHIAPGEMKKPSANMKIYRAIEDSVTFAYTGDKITYLLDYRNFGSVDAKNVKIVENVPADFIVDEASISDGGKYNKAKHTITWDLGTVAGFKSDGATGPSLDLKKGNLAKTIGQVSYKCTIGPKAFGRYCTTAEITCSNGSGWTTNEFPNYITATMQRSCVDVIMRALQIEKTANLEKVNPGNVVEYRIDFENSSKAGWLDGGRPRVTVAMSHAGLGTSQQWLRFRLYSDAIEPYIDYGNYRIAYYMYDSNLKCLAGEDDCAVGWGWSTGGYEGGDKSKVKVTHETIVEGSDELGKWNQRLCVQFSPLLVTTTSHLSNYYGMGQRIHRGGTEPLRLFGYINPSNWADTDFSDDWSWNAKALDEEGGFYYPVSPSWQNIDPTTGKSIEIPVTEYLPSICEKPKQVIENILVEEYDGYVWRRILGTGPMAGREAKNVVVIDTLPKGMKFIDFKNKCPLEDYGASWDANKIADGRWVVKWEIPVMQVKQKGSIIYTAEASFPSGADCPTADELTQNVAWILAEKNSPLSDTAEVTVTCAKVPKPIVPTTLIKTVDKEKVEVGDAVTYTIEYEQTHGFIAEDALKNASDWSLKNATISGGVISMGGGMTAQYKYSAKSENIYVSFHCKVAPYEKSSFFFRDDIEITMDPQWADISFTCTQGGTSKGKSSVVNNKSEFDLTVDLTDDILRIWFDKDTTNSADVTFDGLKKKAGYFGFKGGGGQYQYSKVYVHTDIAYDLSIIDKKPAEIKFGEAKNGGKLDGDSIVWKFEQGINSPIPFGKKFTVTWEGTVEECNEIIVNEAYAKLLGHSDDEIRAMVTSTCEADEPCEGVQKATLEIDDAQLCEGEKTVIRATADPAGKYEYEYFLDGVSIEVSKYDTLEVSDAGEYKVKISDPSCAEATPASSKSVELVLNPIPDKDIAKDQSLCGDETLDLSQFTATGYIVKWFTDEDMLFAVTDLEIKGEDANNVYYYTLTDSKSSCVGEPKPVNVKINEIPATPTVKTKEYPLTKGSSVDISDLVTPSKSGNTLIWYEDETSATPISKKPMISLDIEGKFSYYVSERSPEKCEGERVIVEIDVVNSNKPSAKDTIVCVGEIVDLSSLAKADDGNTLVWYDENGDEATSVPVVNTENAGEYVFKVAQKDAIQTSETSDIKITVIGVSEVSANDISYCSGDEVKNLEYEVGTTGKFTNVEWYLNGNKQQGFVKPDLSNISASTFYTYEIKPYYEIAKGHVCEGEKKKVVLSVAHVDAPRTDNFTYTFSDTLADGTFESLTAHNPSAVKASLGHSLVWYDEDGNELSGAPIPVADKDMAEEQKTLIYYVSQRNSDGCTSDKVKITVTISKTPVPDVKVAYFCEDSSENPEITDFAEPSEVGYSLVWYDGDPKNGGALLPAPPTINVSIKDPDQVEEVTTYYVAQTDGTITSSAIPLEIHIFAKPRLITENDTVCAKPVNINSLWKVSKKVTTIYTNFYEDDVPIGLPESVQKTGNYSVEGYFKLQNTGEKCLSKRENIYVEIHTLDKLAIEGSASVCPSSPVTLKGLYDGQTYGSVISYTWNVNNNSSVAGELISDPLNDKTIVMLIASDGYCKDTVYQIVDIDKGEVSGNVTISEANNEHSPETLLAGTNIEFFSCGGEVTIAPDVKSTDTDFEWSDGTTGKVLKTDKPGTYTLTYTNVCKTFFDVKITAVPLRDLTQGADIPLCENGNATLTLDLQCDEEIESITWYKDGDEQSCKESKLVIERAKEANAGVYTYEAKNKGCVVKGTYGTVTVSPEPVYTLKPVTKLCAGTSAEIGLESLTPNTATVEWEVNPALTAAGNTAVITPTATDVYTLRIIQEGGCMKEEKIKVTVARPISFEVSPSDTTVCEGAPAVKLALKVTDGDVLSYKWKNGNGDVVSTTSLYRADAGTTGEYKYTVVLESEACDSVTEVVNVNVVSNPVIDKVVQKGYKDAEVIVLEGTGSGVYEYKVDAGEYQSDNRLTVKNYGKHTYTVRDDAGCLGTFDFDIIAPEITIPVVVTPNGDGENDSFISEVLSEAYPNATVTIYDRRGKVVAKIPASEGWDGTYNGHRMPSTDYWYEIWVEELRKTYVGHFTLIND